MSESVVAAVETVKRIDEELALLQKHVLAWTDRSSKSGQQYSDAVAAWEGRVRAANAANEDFNEPRPVPSISADVRVSWSHDTRATQADLQGRRLRAVVEAREEIEAAARKSVDRGVKAMKQMLEKAAKEALHDVRAGQIAMEELNGATRMLDPLKPRPGHTPRMYSLMDLVSAVNDGLDPLDPWRVTSSRTLGMQHRPARGEQSVPAPRPSTSDPVPEQSVTVTRTNRGAEL